VSIFEKRAYTCLAEMKIDFTNYIEFIWVRGELVQQESLCYLSDIESKKYKGDKEKEERVAQLLLNFFSQVPQKITHPDHLAVALAVRCRNLKDFINDELERQSKQNERERLYDLYDAFRSNIFTELSIAEFSDAFAQMLTYGMFLAGLNADTQVISLDNVKKYIPTSFQLIKELISFLDESEKSEYQETKWVINEIIAIINHIEWSTFQQNMSFKQRNDQDLDHSDPYIYFYETFLAAYDYHLRKAKGVYYTPLQVVNFIVRAIDEVLTHTFQLPNGLAECKQVTVLDFATETGTFLLETFRIILENIPQKNPEKLKFSSLSSKASMMRY
jgi:type I restriction-modification system DNA methylase subunit